MTELRFVVDRVILATVVVFLVLAPVPGAAQEIVPFPRDLAFNNGAYVKDLWEEQEQLGHVRITHPTNVMSVVRHHHIEVYESDDGAAPRRPLPRAANARRTFGLRLLGERPGA